MVHTYVSVIIHRCAACTSEVYGSVFVCLCIAIDCYSCSRKSFCIINLECHAVFSEECIAKLVHGVLLYSTYYSSQLCTIIIVRTLAILVEQTHNIYQSLYPFREGVNVTLLVCIIIICVCDRLFACEFNKDLVY